MQPLAARQVLAKAASHPPAAPRHVHTYALSAAAVCQVFKAFVRARWDTYAAAAEHYGVSAKFLAKVVGAQSLPTSAMLEDIGWQRARLFIPSRHDHATLPPAAAAAGEASAPWTRYSSLAAAAIRQLEGMGVFVCGYECRRPDHPGHPMQPIISIAAPPAAAALQGKRLGTWPTQDGASQTFYCASLGGCLVRWHEIDAAAPAVEDEEAPA